jgi:hypothetical protein
MTVVLEMPTLVIALAPSSEGEGFWLARAA